MTDDSNLDARLRALEADGWRLRVCHTLRKPDRDDASVRSFHADSLESVVKRVEQEVRTAPKRRVQETAALPRGWVALPPHEARPDEWVHSAEKMVSGKPQKQSASSASGLQRACREFDDHRARSKPDIDPEMERRLASSNIATGLVSSETYRRNTN